MTLDELIKLLSKKVEIVAGFPKDKQVIYPPDDRKGRTGKGGETVAEVANKVNFGKRNVFWQELNKGKGGRIDIPPRPFMQKALHDNKDEIKRLVINAFSIRNLRDETRFDRIGKKLQLMIRNAIKYSGWVPNSKRTIVIKKSTKPLIDSSVMINNVNYEIREKK